MTNTQPAGGKALERHAVAAVGRDIEAATGLFGADFGILTRISDLARDSLSQAALLTLLGWKRSPVSSINPEGTRHFSRGTARKIGALRASIAKGKEG